MSNTNNTNSFSAQNVVNASLQSSQQKGISLLKPIAQLVSPPVLFTPNKLQQQQVITSFKNQSLTDRVVSPQIQIDQNNINQQGGTAKIVARPSLPHQIATSPKPSVGNLLQTTIQNKKKDEEVQNLQSNHIQNNSTLNQFQVVTVTSRNISPGQNTLRQQRFYSPTPLALKEAPNISQQQQNKSQQSSQVQTIYKCIPHPSQNLKQQLPQQHTRFQPSALQSNSASKQTTQNSDGTQAQVNAVINYQANIGDRGLIQNQVINQRIISPPHMLNPAIKPSLNSQAAIVSIQKGNNNQHIRSQTQVTQQGATQIQNSFAPANNIMTIISPQVQQYQAKPVENIIQNNSQLHSQQKQSVSENLTGSENQQFVQKYSQDLTHSNNAKIILVNSQSRNYIVNNLIHSQSSPNKGLAKAPLADKNTADQNSLKQIDSSNLSPEAQKLYEMIGKYNIISKDNSQNNANNNSSIAQNSTSIQRSQSPTERYAFGQKEIKIVQPISSLAVYPQTKIISTQIITQSPVHIIANTSLVDAQKTFQTPVSHSLDARRNASTHKSAKSSRSVSQDNENKNNLSIVIEVNSATKNRRIIEGSPVRSQSPAVIQGGQPIIQNSPVIRKTHYYKKGNRTLTLQEVLQEKQKEGEEKFQTFPDQEIQTTNKINEISPLKYDSIIENSDDRINQNKQNKNYLSYNQNHLYSTESNNAYSTNQPSLAFNTNYQQSAQFQLQQEQILKQQRESLEQQKNKMIQAERKAQTDSYDSILREGNQQEIEMKQQFEKQQREFAQKINQQQEEFQRQLQLEQERRASSQDSQLKESQLKLQLEKQQHEYLAKIQQEQLEFQKHFLVQQAEQKSLLESQLIKESQMKEQKLKEQIERQQYEQQLQQQKYQEEKLRLEREQQELQGNLQNQAKELEKIKLQIEQDKKKEVEQQLLRQQEDQQKQFDKLSQQQQNLILHEQEIQRQKELEQKKYIEQQQQQFQLMLQAQQQMSAEERKQFKEIYNQQQEELKKLQSQQLDQQKQFAEQLQSIIKQHNQQLDNLKKEQDQQTKDLKEMLLNQSRSQQGSPQNANDSIIIFEKLREEKEQLMKQQVEQALQLERQKQELKEKEFKMMQEQQQMLLQQQAQQLESLKKKQAEQEEQQHKLFEQKQMLENQFNEYKSKTESSQINSYEMSNSDRVEMHIYDGQNRQHQNNRGEVEVQRAVNIPQEDFDIDEQDEEGMEKQQLQNKQTIKYKGQQPAGQKQGVQEIAELYRELEDQGFEITDQNWQTQKLQNQQSENGDKKNKLAGKQGYKTQEAEDENIQYQEQIRQKQQSTDRNTENQRNGDYINLYSSSNNSRVKQITEDEEANRRKYQHQGYEETKSQEAEEGEDHNQQYQDQQNQNLQDKYGKSNKNAKLSEQLLQIEQEIQRLQFEEQQARSKSNQNTRLNKKNKNLCNRDGVVQEENQEDYQSSNNKKKKKLTTKNQQIIYADEKKQKGAHKIFKSNQVEKSSGYVPGQRLYEYAFEKTKRKEEIKKLIDQEREQKEIEQCTFNPRLVSTNRYFDEFHSRNEKWVRQKEINIDQKTNFEKEKEVRECTFHPEFYTPNKLSSQYTNISNDPTSLYKRQMEWKNRIESEKYRQKEENEIMIKERSNEIFNSGRQRSQMMNSPPKNSEYEVVGQINYSQRLNKILSSCRKKNSGNFNDDYQSMDQNSYQKYNQQNQNYGQYQDLQESQANQNNFEKGETIIKNVTRPINLEENYDLVSQIQGIMRQSNYCKQNIELDQMIAQQNKLQRSQFGNSNIDKKFDSSSKKNSHKVSQQGSDYIISKEEIKQKQFERLNEDIQQNKQIEITKYPILAERKEYSQVIGNVFVQKNKYVLACQADPYLNQPQHYNEQLSQQDQEQQKHEQMIIQQNIEANLNQQQQNSQLIQGGNSSAYYVADRKYQVVQQQALQQVPPQFIQDGQQAFYNQSSEIDRRIQVSKTSNGDEVEELITNENQEGGMYSLPNTLQNTQHENYQRAQITDESEEVL